MPIKGQKANSDAFPSDDDKLQTLLFQTDNHAGRSRSVVVMLVASPYSAKKLLSTTPDRQHICYWINPETPKSINTY